MDDDRELRACLAMLTAWREAELCKAAKKIFSVFDVEQLLPRWDRATQDYIDDIGPEASLAEIAESDRRAGGSHDCTDFMICSDVDRTLRAILNMPPGMRPRLFEMLQELDPRYGPLRRTIESEYQQQERKFHDVFYHSR